MKTFCTTSGAWLSRPEQVCALMERSLAGDVEPATSVLIDYASVSREKSSCPTALLGVVEIDLRDWVTETLTEGGVINVDVVRRRAQTFSPDDVVVIAATGFLPEIISKTLNHLRLGLYSADTWPRAIAIACDEALIYQIMPALAHAFYLRPAIVIETTVNRYVQNLIWQGNTLRRFGAHFGAFASRIQRFINKSHASLERKIAKKHGWVWGE